jgi:5-methylcytosine-specific restriction protein A
MPIAAPRPCSHPGCGVLVRDGTGRCAKHPKPAWSKPANATKRVTGRKLQALRADLFMRKPLCEECERHGRVTLVTQRDHRVPLAEGGADDASNEQALCKPCHEAKSLQEALRGRRRSSGGHV